MRLLSYLSLMFSMFLDFLYAPLVRAHMREVVLRAPVIPGQIWVMPGLGDVRVVGITGYHVRYKVESDPFSDEYTCPRKDFVLHSMKRDEEAPKESKLGLVIPFNKKEKETE